MPARGRVVVVGLGPAGLDLVLPAARFALESIPDRYARTERHPALAALRSEELPFTTFDDRYDVADDLEAVYVDIVRVLVARANEAGAVVYAVPGSPTTAERTVVLLAEAAAAVEITLELIPGLPFSELAWARLGIDPVATGARVVRAHDVVEGFDTGSGPVLIAQCDHRFVLSDVKLALLELLEPDDLVVVLARLGLPDESIVELPLAELDQVVQPDHLTSVFTVLRAGDDERELARLLALARRLRGPGGCPWDAEQTHHSLTRYLLEESYEVVEAVQRLPIDAPVGEVESEAYAALEDELGDLLYQVIFHAILAEEADAFGMADVARGIHDKLVRRHPHVFGDVEAASSSDVMRNWEQIKKEEKGTTSIVAGITPGLPALLTAHKLYRKAASVGMDPGDAEVAAARLVAASEEATHAPPEAFEAALGEVLAAAVVLARAHGVDAESTLTGWTRRFRDRFLAMEAMAAERGTDLSELDAETIRGWWDALSPSDQNRDS
jgi:tetrapyrrole methylase family protein/MazG family protein